MEQPPSSVATDEVWKEKELIELMEKSLPTYVIRCFLNSGFDYTAAIAQMTTEGPQNSLDKIEQFILMYFPSDASCYSPTQEGIAENPVVLHYLLQYQSLECHHNLQNS